MREIRLAFGLMALAALASGATLERLSMDDLSVKSTEIVRGRVAAARSAYRGPIIYTYYSVQILECLKGERAGTVEVAVPGGSVGDYRQTFSGSPSLTQGAEYVLFLWTGPSGTTQLTGLSQGLFDVRRDSSGVARAMRAASNGLLLDPANHRVVEDAAVRVDYTELKARVASALQKGASR